MPSDTEREISQISQQILYTYFAENRLDFLFSLLAEDIVWVGVGKYLKAEGRQAVCQFFTNGKAQMFPCLMSEELYIARPLGENYWFCEAVCDLETKPGLPLFFHECQRSTFIYRRNAHALSGLGWELIHLNNSIAWTQIQPQELFALSTGMKNYDLLQQRNETELTSPDLAALYELIERNVYAAMIPETQELLQLLCIFDTFTTEQAEFMWQRGNAATLLTAELPRNSFLTFDAAHSQYRFHHTFAGFLNRRISLLGETWQKTQQQRAAAWYLQSGNYEKAMTVADAAGDYEILLTAIERGTAAVSCHQPFQDRCQYFKQAPPAIQRRHILAGVILALDMFAHDQLSPLFGEQEKLLRQHLQDIQAVSSETVPEEGYWEIFKGLTTWNDISTMSSHLQRACQLLPQGVPSVLITKYLTMASPSLLYIYYNKTGTLENDLSLICELTRTSLSHLDQRDTSGLGDMMEAEWLYFMGRLDEAEIKAFKVQEMACRSHSVTSMLCAYFLQSRIGLAKGNWEQINYFLNQAEAYVKEDTHPWHRQAWMLGTSYIYSLLDMQQGITKEISQGQMPADFNQPLTPFFYMLYEKSLLLCGEYRKLIGLFPVHYEAASRFPNVLAQIYLSLFAAIAYLKLFHKEEGIQLLRQAITLAKADGIAMPFAEHMQYIALPLKQLLYTGWEQAFIRYIQTLSLEKKILSLQQQLDKKTMGCRLTRREKDIVELIMTGLANRDIAEKLGIAEVTVKKVLSHLYKKSGVKNRTGLIHYFSQHGEF